MLDYLLFDSKSSELSGCCLRRSGHSLVALHNWRLSHNDAQDLVQCSTQCPSMPVCSVLPSERWRKSTKAPPCVPSCSSLRTSPNHALCPPIRPSKGVPGRRSNQQPKETQSAQKPIINKTANSLQPKGEESYVCTPLLASN